MIANEGTVDRALRAVIVLVAAVCAAVFTHGVAQIVLWAMAAIMAITAVVGFCPLYRIIGIDTCKVKR
ncbi:YgaP family membrane protein [Corynebacterium hindlerae]|uniref:YgaP family membrane protein n=1 Tax=Corynebacterium hindlerae TaxID=699041 RepID=UPI003AAD918B